MGDLHQLASDVSANLPLGVLPVNRSNLDVVWKITKNRPFNRINYRGICQLVIKADLRNTDMHICNYSFDLNLLYCLQFLQCNIWLIPFLAKNRRSVHDYIVQK